MAGIQAAARAHARHHCAAVAEEWVATPLAVRQFLAALLTIVTLQKQQHRHLLTFVTEAIEAHRAGRHAPTLLPTQL
jgi:hypothetical protein